MNDKLLKETMEKTQKTIEQSKEWQVPYNEQVKLMLEQREMLKQFYKTCKQYEYVQFYLVEVIPTLPHQIKIQMRYWGQVIATITLSKEGATITTENDISKKTFNCPIQLKEVEWDTKEAIKFMEYFNKPEIPIKAKLNETSKTESLLLEEISKTSSYNKLIIGIQSIKFENLYIPITAIGGIGKINVLTRSKVRKISIIEVVQEGQTLEQVQEQITNKAIFLLNLLKTEQGDNWYKLFGYKGRRPTYPTIKVCIATPKTSKIKDFEPFEIRTDIGVIDYRYMCYDQDNTSITSIKTNIND